jgi:hypothetical protein
VLRDVTFLDRTSSMILTQAAGDASSVCGKFDAPRPAFSKIHKTCATKWSFEFFRQLRRRPDSPIMKYTEDFQMNKKMAAICCTVLFVSIFGAIAQAQAPAKVAPG